MSKANTTGNVSWRSPANIALVKYWGKHGNQLPQNPSVSLTLAQSVSVTEVSWSLSNPSACHRFSFEGQENQAFQQRVFAYLDKILCLMPSLAEYSLDIRSRNTFPHSSGISSSASFMSSLALCLADMEQLITGNHLAQTDFFRKASILARMGSGSGARSVFGGYTIWGRSDAFVGSSDEFAIPVNSLIHPVFRNYHDAILVVSSRTKPLSSSEGHALMDGNPFAKARYESAGKNIREMIRILGAGDQMGFIRLLELEALTLHGLILASDGGKILMEPATLAIIRKIREFRAETGLHPAFTLDAGPNVHLLYPDEERIAIKAFIETTLVPLCENGRWIDDEVGAGPKKVTGSWLLVAG